MAGARVFQRLAALLCACTTACAPFPPLPNGKELAITLAPDPASAQVVVGQGSDTSVPAAATGGLVGGSAGIAAAAACPGFTVLVCLPIFMVGGGLAGAATLTIADHAATVAPSPLTQLEHKLAAFARQTALQEQLLRTVRDKASAQWRLVPASDETSMTLRLTALSLHGDGPDKLSLTVHVTAAVQSTEVTLHPPRVTASGDPRVGDKARIPPGSGRAVLKQSFFYDGPTADISQWMDESNALLNAAIATAYEAIAKQMVGALAGEGRPIF